MSYTVKFAEDIDSSKEDIFIALKNVLNTWDKVKEILEIDESEQSVYFRYKTGNVTKCWIRIDLEEITDNSTKSLYIIEWSATPGSNTSILDRTLQKIAEELHLQVLSALGKDELVQEWKSEAAKNRAITLVCVIAVILIFLIIAFFITR